MREEITEFAEQMEGKMAVYDESRGDSWKNEDLSFFIDRMEEELAEVKEEYKYYLRVASDDCRAFVTLGKLKKEAADVANFAMMLSYQSSMRSLMHEEKLRRENAKIQQTIFHLGGKKYTVRVEDE